MQAQTKVWCSVMSLQEKSLSKRCAQKSSRHTVQDRAQVWGSTLLCQHHASDNFTGRNVPFPKIPWVWNTVWQTACPPEENKMRVLSVPSSILLPSRKKCQEDSSRVSRQLEKLQTQLKWTLINIFWVLTTIFFCPVSNDWLHHLPPTPHPQHSISLFTSFPSLLHLLPSLFFPPSKLDPLHDDLCCHSLHSLCAFCPYHWSFLSSTSIVWAISGSHPLSCLVLTHPGWQWSISKPSSKHSF